MDVYEPVLVGVIMRSTVGGGKISQVGLRPETLATKGVRPLAMSEETRSVRWDCDERAGSPRPRAAGSREETRSASAECDSPSRRPPPMRRSPWQETGPVPAESNWPRNPRRAGAVPLAGARG